ncbi:MAG TPA: T9SS type A sorting domain-containing protein [Paludibacteraceae bacterium]|nr:T9SS type A sorting domain-containing protein [Paludibacteraceae bacterium]HOS38017.1 T9SS type A sorting domain-containing protein [Paludibacteraceae bacterium]HPK20991.1 T9SS type A sorting domain-containing protein [Paludibacteraceae bacterium]
MKTKIYSLSLLLVCCMTAMAIVPQKRVVKDLRSDKSTTLIVQNQQKATAVVTATNEEGVIYVEDFEEDACAWKFIQTPGETENAYQIGIVTDNVIPGMTGTCPAASGDRFVAGSYEDEEGPDVNHWAISDAITLAPGTYWVSFFVINSNLDDTEDGFRLCYGANASVAAMTNVVVDYTGANFELFEDWTLIKKQITVEAEGTFYFGWNHQAPAFAYFALFDWFRITTFEPENPKPIILGVNNVTNEGTWSALQYNTIYLPNTDAEIGLAATTNFVDTYDWSAVGVILTYEDSTNVMSFTYPQTATGEVSLKVANNEGDTTATWEYQGILKAAAGTTDLLFNLAPGEEPNSMGYNVSKNYKMSYAEGFDHLDTDEEAHIKSVTIGIYEAYFEDYGDSIMSVRILGGKIGQGAAGQNIIIPDDTKEFGRKNMTFKEFLQNQDAYIEAPGDLLQVTFDEPINVTGNYFVAIDLVQPDTLKYSLDNNYISILCLDRGNGSPQPTSWWRPYTVYVSWNDEDGWVSEGEYYRTLYYNAYGVDYTHPISLLVMPEVVFGPYVNINNVKADNKLSIYPTPAKDMLYVENMAADATVAIMDIMGRTVANYTATSVQKGISLKGLSNGIYVISVKDAAGIHTSKFMKE